MLEKAIGMNFTSSVKVCLFGKYRDFSGRASRSEFWWFTLFYYMVLIFGYIVFSFILIMFHMMGLLDGGSVVSVLVSFLGMACWISLLIPAFAVTVRRLHDRNLSGWWILGYYGAMIVFALIPVLGPILLFAEWIGAVVLLSQPGKADTNRFGANPLITDATHDVFA